MAPGADADRACLAIRGLYRHCQANKLGNIGYPQFGESGDSVEYKSSGWKLSDERKYLTFTLWVQGRKI
jgi:putative transposase